MHAPSPSGARSGPCAGPSADHDGFDPHPAALLLAQARTGQSPRLIDLPAPLRPHNQAQAYAVQDAVVRLRGPVVGWKVGAAAPDAEPVRAALTADSVWIAEGAESCVHLPPQPWTVRGVEAEWVYELRADLPPRLGVNGMSGANAGTAAPYTPAEVLAAVASVRVAIEVCDTRYAAWGQQSAWSTLADQACHGALVVGSGVKVADGADGADGVALQPLDQPVQLHINGELAVDRPAWGNPAGEPLRLLCWLANGGAHSLGGLRAGQWVTTGSCTGTVLVAPASRVTAVMPGLGQAQLQFG